MNSNTSPHEDKLIRDASEKDYISGLIDIINRLDSMIDDLNEKIKTQNNEIYNWIYASGCPTPEDLESRIEKLGVW